MSSPVNCPFVHLHVHSEYSLLDGGNRIERLVARVKELGMDAVAITDHGNLYGAIEFYTAARAAGIKPILGIEAYVAPGDRRDRTPTGIADGGFHLVLLAENDTGWRNLVRLSSDSFLKGFYYRPRMDTSTLAQWADGLIAINGHLGSSLAHHLTLYAQTNNRAHWDSALEEARWHAATFRPAPDGAPRFYIELQRHVPEQERINPLLTALAGELSLPLVVDNDAHFLRAEDWDAHDTLCCISMGKVKSDTARLHYPKELYLKSPGDMQALFADHPEAVANSAAIAARCGVTLSAAHSSAIHAPLVRVVRRGEPPALGAARDLSGWFNEFCSHFELEPVRHEDVQTEQEKLARACSNALAELARAGAIWRYGAAGVTDSIRRRLDWELKVLADKNISAYFLIVWDFVNWARQRGIPAAARGSGVGTMVGYVLGLSNACPERYGLLFERFTDPDRSEYPDIDIDICQDGRAAVLEYVRQKYGHVAQIITFGRLKAKAAIKDVARVMGLTPAEGQRLANLVPGELHITIDDALAREPDFRRECETSDVVRSVVETARALEDHARHAGIHAAGVVIATQPLEEIVPLCKTSGSDDVVTQWDGPTCEKVGLLKMDFLGLRTLSTIELCKKLIRESLPAEAIRRAVSRTAERAGGAAHPAGPPGLPETEKGSSANDPLDLDRLSFDDPRVFDLFRRGDTAGVFQFESGGMRKLLVEMQPDRLEDLIAANALYRPGPMDLIADYCMRKHGRQPVPRVHPIVDQFTAETYGIMVYQEQVMQIVHGLGDIPLRSAYTLIKAISKKKKSVIDEQRPKFIEGARRKGLTESKAAELFELILAFAGYGFNKSHSTGYAIIAYQTAYLKTFFPNQYMAALLTYESAAGKVEDWSVYLEECRRAVFPDSTPERPHLGVCVRPPDVNRSEQDFAVVFDEGEPREAVHGHVRFGLNAIKGIPGGAIRAIVEERRRRGPFSSFFDFIDRADLKAVTRATIESLVKCGAFDALHSAAARAAMIESIESTLAAAQQAADDRRTGQMNFFGSLDAAAAPGPDAAGPAPQRRLPATPPWDTISTLAREKEALGFHVSGHPLDRFDDTITAFATCTIRELAERPHDARVVVAGVLGRVRMTLVRNGQAAGEKMAVISVQDRAASIEGVVFSSVFARDAARLRPETPVLLIGRVDRMRGEVQIIVEQVLEMHEAPLHLTDRLELDLVDEPEGEPIAPTMEMVAGLLRQSAALAGSNGGRPAEVIVRLWTGGQRITLRAARLRVVPDAHLLDRLREAVGEAGVRCVGGLPPPADRRGGGAGAAARRRAEPVPV